MVSFAPPLALIAAAFAPGLGVAELSGATEVGRLTWGDGGIGSARTEEIDFADVVETRRRRGSPAVAVDFVEAAEFGRFGGTIVSFPFEDEARGAFEAVLVVTGVRGKVGVRGCVGVGAAFACLDDDAEDTIDR